MKSMPDSQHPSLFAFKPLRLAVAVGLAACLASGTSVAQDDDYELTSSWYGGFNFGQTHESINDGAVANSELGGGLNFITDDRRDNGFKIFGGYQFTDHFAMEAGYFDLGQFGFRAVKDPLGALKSRTKTRGFNLDVLGIIPLSDRWSLFGRAGVHYSEAYDRFQGIGDVVVTDTHRKERDTNFKWGGGFQYDFSEKWAMRIEAERYAIEDITDSNGKINLYSLGVVYRFGDVRATKKIEDEPVTQRDKLRDKYCTTLDVHFDVNHAEVQAEHAEQLAVVGKFLNRYSDTTAVIEGHTDNVGSEESNMTLSRNRAESVRNYLVREQRVQGSRITAEGYGESRPIADNSTEEGKRANRRVNAVISCAEDVQGLEPPAPRKTLGMRIHFEGESTELQSQYRSGLAEVVSFLKDNPKVKVAVEGHAANVRNSASRAQNISVKRAEAVVDYLANAGVDRSQLSAEGFGNTRRYAYNDTAEGRRENSRVDVIFHYPK